MDERYYKRVEWLRTTICSVPSRLCDLPRLVNRPTVFLAVAVAILPGDGSLANGQGRRPVKPPPAITALDPRWTLSFADALAAPAGFDQELTYVPVTADELIAYALDDGTEKWRATVPTQFTPATGDGFVFAAGGNRISALEQRSGQAVWQRELAVGLNGPVHWESGMLVASTVDGQLVALRAEDGAPIWTSPMGSPFTVAPSASQNRLYAALQDGRLVAVHLETGEVIWTTALNEQATGVLALQEQLLVGTRANLLHSFSIDRGRRRWTQKVGADVIGAPSADADKIYFVSFDNVVRALSRRNGNMQWTRNLPSRPSGGPVLMENLVFVPLAAQAIGAYAAETGAEAFTLRAAGEVSGAPYLREHARPTLPRLIAHSREGALQGFATRIEPPPADLTALPGAKVGG